MDEENDKAFLIEYAKTGRANCKKCKQKCDTGKLRMAKVVPSPFGSGTMNNWYHVDCIFESFKTQRATTKSIETIDDIDGWATIGDLDKDSIMEKLEKLPTFNVAAEGTLHNSRNDKLDIDAESKQFRDKYYNENSKDNLFREFRKICLKLSDESSYLGKTAILHKFFLKGSNGERFEGKLYCWIKMLLPSADKRVYNVQSKQLIKLFARIFNSDASEMMVHLEQGDVASTISNFFQKSDTISPAGKSYLTLEKVDKYLDQLCQLTKEDEQMAHFRKLCKHCTASDLEMIIRLIKHDIRINSGPKHILEALSKDAYPAYQSCKDLVTVVAKFGHKISENKLDSGKSSTDMAAKGSISVQLMSPISPMLAEACKSVEKAIAKCPAGMYSEIKYDGERVQLHKKGNEFKFFTRNLKPVQEHKIKGCKEFVPLAFPNANDLILDSEIIAVDTTTGELLPFGTLGKHKKTEHKTSEVCLFIFDCIYYNGNDLTKKTMKERRKILEDNIRPIKNHVQLSEYHLITKPKELSVMIAKVLQMGLEGLVLKNVNGIYEPGKRHWLKVKKDYLFDGKMADSADLVVLGAWFGTGKKGGMLSIFLMGCLDARTQRWKTVTKVHTGLDDKTLDKMQKVLNPLMCRADPDSPPSWLICKKPLIPDMLAIDPTEMPVWEITGAEFSKSEIHTADGISIRFPRITKQRDDKSAAEATTLKELHKLFEASKECTNLQMLTDGLDDAEIDIKTKLQGGAVASPVKRSAGITDHDNDDDAPAANIKRSKIDSKELNKNIAITSGLCSKPGKSLKKQKLAYCDDSSSSSSSSHYVDKNQMKQFAMSENGKGALKSDKMGNAKSSAFSVQSDLPNAVDKTTNEKKMKRELEIDENEAKEKEVIARKVVVFVNIFEEVKLYVPLDVRGLVKEELRYFQLWGGTEIESPKKATVVLHKEQEISGKWKDIRERYSPSCRHVHYKWLVKCVKTNIFEEIECYPVLLKTSV